MKNLFQYQGKVEPVFNGPETPQLDKWFSQLSEPKRFAKSLAIAVVLAASGNFFVAPTEAPAETVTVDKYRQELSVPQSKLISTVYLNSSFSIDSSSLLNPESPQLDKWYQDLSKPFNFRTILDTSLKLSFVIDPVTPSFAETISLDKWYQDLLKPTLPAEGLTTALRFSFSIDQSILLNPEAPQLDKWYQELSKPLGLSRDSEPWLKLSFAIDPVAPSIGETVSLDKWYQALSKPQLKARKLSESQRESYSIGLVQPVASIDTWFEPLSVPVRMAVHFDTPVQNFQKDFIPEVTQLDKWFNALELPVRAKLNYSIYNQPSGFLYKPEALFLNLSITIREAILADSSIVALLGVWQGEASVHTRRPAPSEAGLPIIMISGDISVTDEDSLTSKHPVVTKDIICYGDQPLHYRQVEEVGILLRELFHRNRHSISLSGWHVIDITVRGPFVAPADDDKTCARGITMTVRLLDLRNV